MVVLDTNVVSEAMKPVALRSDDVMAWLRSQPSEDIFTTTVTLAEVLAGIQMLPMGKRRAEKHEAANRIFTELFFDRILPFDEPAASAYADITTVRRKNALTIDVLDIQIAAIAKSRGMAVATRNTVDFEGNAIELINPWKT
jgi:predicted nucleic acid-binding protein